MPVALSPLLEGQATAVVGDASKSFECHVSARPVPAISWFLDDVELVHDGSKYNITMTTTPDLQCSSTKVRSTLTIFIIDLNDMGNITCMASHTVGTVETLNQTIEFITECKMNV